MTNGKYEISQLIRLQTPQVPEEKHVSNPEKPRSVVKQARMECGISSFRTNALQEWN